MENGKFVKADIFEHPVSFAVESHANVGSPEDNNISVFGQEMNSNTWRLAKMNLFIFYAEVQLIFALEAISTI